MSIKASLGSIHNTEYIHKTIQNIFRKNSYWLGNIHIIMHCLGAHITTCDIQHDPNFVKTEKSTEGTAPKCEQQL